MVTYPQSIDRTVQITDGKKNVAYLCVQVEICYLTIGLLRYNNLICLTTSLKNAFSLQKPVLEKFSVSNIDYFYTYTVFNKRDHFKGKNIFSY